MKHLKFILSNLILCMLLASYTACSSDNDSGDEPTNPIEKEYFSIKDAQYINQELPSGTDDLTTAISTTKHVVNGGSVIITILSEKSLSKANVTTDNIKGYYQVELKPSTTTRDTSTDGYEYDIVLNVIQNIKAESFKVSISVEDSEGKISTVNTSSDVNIVEAGTGKLQISLSWDELDDLDLFVITPDGKKIYHGNQFFVDPNLRRDSLEFEYYKYVLEQETGEKCDIKWEDANAYDVQMDYEDMNITEEEEVIWIKNFSSQCKGIYGLLDIDSNAACDIDGINNENVYLTQLVKGTYTVVVNLYKKCDQERRRGAKYSISAFLDGKPFTISDKQVGRYAMTATGNNTGKKGKEEYVEIGSFTINEGIELPKKTRVITNDTELDYTKTKSKSRFQ